MISKCTIRKSRRKSGLPLGLNLSKIPGRGDPL
jgi:hypothetical protein